MQNNPEHTALPPTEIPTSSMVKKLDGATSKAQKEKASRIKSKPNLSLNQSLNTSTGANESSTVNLLNEEAIRKGKQNMADSSIDLSPINRSLSSSLNTSTGANESSTVNLLNEEAIREGKQNMADVQEEEENGSFISNEDDDIPERGDEDDDSPPVFSNLHPLDLDFLYKLYKANPSLKDMKATCSAYGLNPNTAKHAPAHTGPALIRLATTFMAIRKDQEHLTQLNEQDFEEMLRFGNLPTALIVDKQKRGEAANMFKRWWSQSLVDLGRMSPTEVGSFPVAGVRALLGTAGYKVDKSSATRPTAIDTFKQAQVMLAQQGHSTQAYPNNYFTVASQMVLTQGSSHLIYILHCAFGGDIETFDIDNIKGIITDITQSQAPTIDSTVFAADNLSTLDAQDLRILNDMFGRDFAATQHMSRDDLQRMLPGDLNTRCEHRPSYTPPNHRTTSKIANDLRNLALIPGRQPTHTSANVRHDDEKGETQIEESESDEHLNQTEEDWWNPIQGTTSKSLPTGHKHMFVPTPPPRIPSKAPIPTTVEGWSKLRLIGYLQTVEPKPIPYYERMDVALLTTLIHSRPTTVEYRTIDYDNTQRVVSFEDVTRLTPHTLRRMIEQIWTCTPTTTSGINDAVLASELWESLTTASTTDLPNTKGQAPSSHDPTLNEHLKQLAKMSSTVEKASDTTAKSSRKADEGTRNLNDNLHDHSFHDLCCDDPTKSGATLPMSKLISALYGGVHIQLSLRAYMDLANTLANVSFKDFVPLHLFMGQSEARRMIEPYANWRSEKPINRQAMDYTNNDPELWRQIIRTMLHMTADILDLGTDVRTLCDTIAHNVKRVLTGFPHWSINTCNFVAKRVCEQFDLLRNNIANPARSSLNWTVEGLVSTHIYAQYATRSALVIDAEKIPSWTTPEEMAQFSLLMHDASTLKRDGKATHFITAVGHAEGIRSTKPENSDKPNPIGKPPRSPKRNPKPMNTSKPAEKSTHHCVNYLNSLNGGPPCDKGNRLCPHLHESIFETALEHDFAHNIAAKKNIVLNPAVIGKRPHDAAYPDTAPRKKPKTLSVTFNTALNKKPLGSNRKASSRKRPAPYDPLQTILSKTKVIRAENELARGCCGADAIVAAEFFQTHLYPSRFHVHHRLQHALAVRLEIAYRMIHEQVIAIDETDHTRISTDIWEEYLLYDDGHYTDDKGNPAIHPEANGEIPRSMLAPRQGESTEDRRRRIALRFIVGEQSVPPLSPIWLNADILMNVLRTHVASIAKTGEGRFIGKLVEKHGPANYFAVGPVGLAFIGQDMTQWGQNLSAQTEREFEKAYPIIGTIDGSHFLTYVQRRDNHSDRPYEVYPDDSWSTTWKAEPSQTWRTMAPERLLRLMEMTREAGAVFFDPDNLPPFNLPRPIHASIPILVMETIYPYTFEEDYDLRRHPYGYSFYNTELRSFKSILGRATGLLPPNFHNDVIPAHRAANSGKILYASFVHDTTRKLMRGLYSTDSTWNSDTSQWHFPLIMANDNFFDLEISLDEDTLVCVFDAKLIPADIMKGQPLFTEDEITEDIYVFQEEEQPNHIRETEARKQFSEQRTPISGTRHVTSGTSTYMYAKNQPAIFVAPGEVIQMGQVLFNNIPIDRIDIDAVGPDVTELLIQIRVDGSPVYIFRAHWEAIPLLPTRIHTDSNVYFANVSYHWDTETTILIRSSRECRNEQEFYVESGWYDRPPGDLTMSARMRLCELFWHEFIVTTSPVLRRHVWLLVKGIPRYQFRLCNQWSVTEAPTPQELESNNAFRIYETLQDLYREQRSNGVGSSDISEPQEVEMSSNEPQLAECLMSNADNSTVHSLYEELNTGSNSTLRGTGPIDTLINDTSAMGIAPEPDGMPARPQKARGKTKGELKRAAAERNPGSYGGPEYAAKVNAARKAKKLLKNPPVQGRNISDQKRLLVLLAILASVNTPAFETKLEKLRADYAAKELDYTDDSNIVRDMKSADPPKLKVVTDDMFMRDEAALAAVGNDLRQLYEQKVAKLKYRGLPRESLSTWLHYKLPQRAASLIDLMDNGMTAHMKDGWKPNGGKSKNGKSVDNHLSVIEHAIATLSSNDRNILIREENFPAALKQTIHVHPIITAENPGKPNRVCFHMSSGTKSFPSYNSMVDIETHLRKFPRTPLPSLASLCNMFNNTRAKFPDAEYLHASVVDVSSAYHQYHLAYEKMLLVWTRIQISRDGGLINLLNGNIVGTFGDINAGDVWDCFSRALDELSNALSSLISTEIYVDDGISTAPPFPSDVDPNISRPYFQSTGGTVDEPEPGCPPLCAGVEYAIQSAVIDQRNNIARFFGNLSTEDKKVWIYIGKCIALGWYFNLRYDGWYVLPKPEKMDKILHYLFNVVTVSDKRIPHHTMQQLCGLLCWFSAAIPLGRAFVYTLFQCRRTNDNYVILNSAAQRDLTFWRAVMRVGWKTPALVGASISSLGTPGNAKKFIGGDACTGIGGGAWLSNTPRWEATVSVFCFIVRWTRRELEAINRAKLNNPIPFLADKESYKPQLRRFFTEENIEHNQGIPVHINVLEFAIVVFAIMLWAPFLRGETISIGTDNTACLCWLMKNKSASGVADSLLKILALVCLLYDIRIIAHHVPGIINFLGDWLSRVQGIDVCDARHFLRGAQSNIQDKFIAELHAMAEPESKFNRRDICRAILTRTLVHPDEMTIQLLVSIIVVLQRVPEVPLFPDLRVLQIMDGFTTAENTGADIAAGLPNTLDQAYAQYGTITVPRTMAS